MQKLIIGIVPSIQGFNTNDPFEDQYYCLNSYIKKLVSHNLIPILVLLTDKTIIQGSLELCDGFIFPGGNCVQQHHFDILDYAITHNKPVLGICLGMQAMAMYSMNRDLNEENTLSKVENHYPFKINRNNINQLAHFVEIKEGSILYETLKQSTKIMVNSLHNYQVKHIESTFNCIAKSSDGVIEAIEYNKEGYFILGVQWHPELLNSFDNLWNRFKMECLKRKITQ